MGENVIQINGGIMINVDVSVKSVMYVKKIMLGILLHVIVKMENIQQVLWMIQGLRVMKLQNNTMKFCDKTKAIPKNFNEKKTTCKMKKFYTLLQFLSITIIDSSQYLLLFHKICSKTKHLLPFYLTNNELKEIIY